VVLNKIGIAFCYFEGVWLEVELHDRELVGIQDGVEAQLITTWHKYSLLCVHVVVGKIWLCQMQNKLKNCEFEKKDWEI